MSRAQSGGHGGLSVTTLVIASGSAVLATVVVPLFWEKGTLIATAVTPIVVAVVSDVDVGRDRGLEVRSSSAFQNA